MRHELFILLLLVFLITVLVICLALVFHFPHQMFSDGFNSTSLYAVGV